LAYTVNIQEISEKLIGRPLPTEMINYARADTHYMLYIYNKMKNELLEKGEDALKRVLGIYQ
jgi:ribonuclease D